jgi:glycolate oxidase iron-sulfur subunit
VGLFVGCYLEFADTPIAEAGIRVMTSRGHQVLYPKGQVCCGAPALFTGDLENAVELARINAEAFNESAVETVVTLCATCASALREGYQMLKDHLAQEDQERVLPFSCRVQDISQWLNEHGPPHGLDRGVNLTLTYHDPCHHVRAMGVQEQPRNLLREIAGVRLVEMARPTHCCGGGGSFSFSHPDVSLQVGRAKVDDILATGAQALVTACPGCILQIQDVAQRENASFEVLHLVEVLERALPRTTDP